MCARKNGMCARKYGPLGHQTDEIQNDDISSYKVSGLHITSPISEWIGEVIPLAAQCMGAGGILCKGLWAICWTNDDENKNRERKQKPEKLGL